MPNVNSGNYKLLERGAEIAPLLILIFRVMEKMETKVLVAWLEPCPDREKGVSYCNVSTVRNIKSAQTLIGRLTMQNYRFDWAYIYDENDIDMVTIHLLNKLEKIGE